MEKYFEIGKIVNTYGIKGLLKVVPLTDNIERFSKLKKVYIEKKQYEIEETRIHGSLILIKFKGFDDISQAETLKEKYIVIERKDAVKLPNNSYFITDLLESDVFTTDKEYLGKIIDIFKTGSNDVYVVKDELGKQILLPAIKSVIKTVDIENKKVIINLIEGLK